MSKIHESVAAESDKRQGVAALTSDGSIRHRPEKELVDEFYVSPEQKEEYGVTENEDLRWVRDAAYWQKYELIDRIEQVKAPLHRGGMEGRLLHTKDADKVHIGGGLNGDLVLMAIPRSITEQQQGEIDAAKKEYEKGMVQTEEGYETRDVYEEYKLDPHATRQKLRAEHEYNVRMGLIDPRRRNMNLLQAEADAKRSGIDVAGKQEALRNGGYHADQTHEDFQRLFTGERANRAAMTKKTVSMGDSGFKRNPNSPLAQAQRRAQGG